MSAVATRLASTLDLDRTTAVLLGLGLALVAAVGVGAARQPALAAGATVLLGLTILGLRFPALPFVVALAAYVLISSTPGDNALLAGAEAIYDGPAGLAPSFALIAVAGLAAALAALRATPAERAAAWTPLTGALLLLLAAGILSGLVVHREGREAVLALMPTVRLVIVFLIATSLIATGYLSRTQLLRWSVPAAQVLGALGIYNASFGGADQRTVVAVSSESAAVLDERTLAFYDSESAFVMVVALAVLLARAHWGPAAARARAAALAVLPFIALVLSARRSMWVDLLVGAVLIVLVSARVNPRALVATLVVTAVAGVAFVNITQGSQAYSQRIDALGSLISGKVTEQGLRSRQLETAAVWRNIRANPVTGIGLAKPYLSNVQFRFQEPTYLHNNYLWIWLKFGLLGVLAMGFLIWRMLRTTARGVRPLRRTSQLDDAQATLAAAGVALGFLVAIVTASFLTASVRFPTLVGAVLAVLATAPAATSNMRRPGSSAASHLPST